MVRFATVFSKKISEQGDRDCVGILMINNADAAVRHDPRVFLTVRIAAAPLNQLVAPATLVNVAPSCAVGVELGAVIYYQAFTRTNRRRRCEHVESELTIRCSGVTEREVDALGQRALARAPA